MSLLTQMQSQSYPDGVVTSDGWQLATAATTNPLSTDLAAASTTAGRFCLYMKNKKFVIAYNNAGTVTYISIPMDGSTTTWTHSTTAP